MTAAPVRFLSVHLKDEAPAIGSGLRFVFVKQGRKWVYLLSPYTMRACKMRRGTWEALGAAEVTDPEALTRARLALKAVCRSNLREPTRLERQAIKGGT